jgi:6-phosphogluconolactonase
VLGMGDDGHFASLFPQSPGLSAALDPVAQPGCVAMQAPVAPASRISLNLAALLQTRRLFLFVTGAHKRDVLLAAARRVDPLLPVAALLSQRVPMPEVYWAP